MSYDWHELHSELRIAPSLYPIAVHRPTPELIEQFEHDTGIKLPNSYKQFIQLFGPGELAYDTMIRAPNCVSTDPIASKFSINYKMDLGTWNNELRSGRLDADRVTSRYTNPRLILRLLFFADNLAGDLFGWDPEQPVPDTDGEYVIYVVTPEDDEAVEHKRSYSAFVFETCLFDEDCYVYHPIGDMQL